MDTEAGGNVVVAPSNPKLVLHATTCTFIETNAAGDVVAGVGLVIEVDGEPGVTEVEVVPDELVPERVALPPRKAPAAITMINRTTMV